MKNVLRGTNSGDAPMRTGEQVVAAFGAGAITTLVSNPLNVVRTRMVVNHAGDRFASVGEALNKITAKEGIKGLYKGVVPSLLGVSHGAIQLLAYEKFKAAFRAHKGADNLVSSASLFYITT